MATISPAPSAPAGNRGERVSWSNATETDDFAAHSMGDFTGLAGSVQFSGTFGGATVGLEASNNGADWIKIADGDGVNGFTAGTMLEFSIAAQMIRPYITGGSGTSVDIDVMLRG